MDLADARDFLSRNHRAVLMTRHPDGRPQLSPITCGVDGEGRLTVSTRETAVKARNVLRDPRVWVCVMTDAFFGPWLQIEGEVEVVRLPEAMEPLVDYYRRISGEHPDWDDYRAAMKRDQRVLLRVTMTHVGPSFHG